MKLSNGPLATAALFVSVSLVSCTDDNQMKELREQQRLILAKLDTVEEKIDKASARAQGSTRPQSSGPEAGRAYTLPPGNSPSKGPADAPITIIEFSDYQCPFCSRAEPLVKEALDAYPTKARVVFKHFPLTSIHPNAMPAALAATAAQKQGKFWEMHEKLFANQRELSPEQIKKYAGEIGLDVAKFEADAQSEEVKQAVQEDMQLAQKVGVRGTPTIFVNGKILQTRSLDGFKQIIDPILKEAAAAPAGAQPKGS